jgi:DNA recombination protein RmuC
MIEWIILILLALLTGLTVYLVTRQSLSSGSDEINSVLKDQFLSFQDNIHREMNSTREEVNRSKDVMSQHAVKTLETINVLGKTLSKIVNQQEEAHELGRSLKDLLKAPKLRGNYGEAILEEMLDRVLPKNIWKKQYTIENANKVDAVVIFRNIIIPIDAKFPRDDYLRYLESSTDREKEENWKAHETAVKNQIRSISNKYIKPEAGTSDFALMFIPSESIYYETIAEKNYIGQPSDLYKYASDNNVIPVSPNTFYAFLQVLMMGMRNLDIIKNAKILQEGLDTMYRSFDLFYKQYESIGKQLDKASDAYRKGDSHIVRYKNKLKNTMELEEFESSDSILAGEIPEE